MSIEAMNFAYKQKVGSVSKKAVLVALSNMADHEGHCFPSIRYISERVELSRRAVQSNLSALVESGYISIDERMGKTGQRSNLYIINIEGVQQMRPPVQITTKGGAADAPITIINNHIITIDAQAEFDDWMKVRKKKKAIWTDRIAKRVHAELLKLSKGDPETQRLIIAQSADNGYTDIFPLRDKTPRADKPKVPTELAELRKLVRDKKITLPDGCQMFAARKIVADKLGMQL